MPAGAVGPDEAHRLDRRHIGDSLLFGYGLVGRSHIVDVGSGVGLPGIPLAIAFPETEVTLVDRSAKRMDLARRAVRILGLDNVGTRNVDFEKTPVMASTVVSRATFPMEKAGHVIRLGLGSGGVAVLGGSWSNRPSLPEWETIEVPVSILDHQVWLLMMQTP